jgi:hypothetical protein
MVIFLLFVSLLPSALAPVCLFLVSSFSCHKDRSYQRLSTDYSPTLPNTLRHHEVRRSRVLVFHKIVVKLTVLLPHSSRTNVRAETGSEQQECIVLENVDATLQSESLGSSSLPSLSQRRVGWRTTHTSSSQTSVRRALSSDGSHMNMETYPSFPDEGPAIPLWCVYNGAGWRWDPLSPRFGSNMPLALSVIPGEDEIIPDRIHEREQDAMAFLEGWTWNFIQLGHTQLPNSASQSISWDTWSAGIGSQFT